MATWADADAVAKKTGQATKLLGGKVHTLNVGSGVWQEYKHKRDSSGKFAKMAGVPNVHAPNVSSKPGKQAPANWKFYKPGYKPKEWSKIAGANAHTDGKLLWLAKKNGDVKNDYEFWLLAQKLAAKYKKTHPSNAATANGIVNAAFRHELEETGDVQIGDGGTKSVEPKPLNVPKFDKGKTSTGLSMTSKHAPPGTLTKYIKTMGGATGAQVWEDDKGQEWLVKGMKQGQSNAYSNKNFAVALEEATAKIQNKSGLRAATSHKTNLQGKKVLAQKMFGGVSIAFPGGPDISKMSDADKLEMQKHQMLDWVLSNFDTHTGNFLKDKDGVVGIDKGQAFKFFGKDKLSWDYAPVSPLGSDKPTYQTMWKDYIAGKGELFDFDNGELLSFASRLQTIDDAEYADLLRPYANAAYDANTLSAPGAPLTGKAAYVEHFLKLAVNRKNSVVDDFEEFFKKAKFAKDLNKPSEPKPVGGQVAKHLANKKQRKADSGYVPKVGEGVKMTDFIDGSVSDGEVVGVNATGDSLHIKFPDDPGEPTGVWTKINGKWFFEGDTQSPPDELVFDGEKDAAKPKKKLKLADWSVGDQFEYEGNTLTVSEVVPGHKINAKDNAGGWTASFFPENFSEMNPIEAKPIQIADLKVGDILEHKSWGVLAVEKVSLVPDSPGLSSVKVLDENNKWAKVKQADFDNGTVTMSQFQPTNPQAGKPATPTPDAKLAKGFEVLKNPNGDGFVIKKPGGAFSTNKTGDNKSWPTEQEALDSSTMAKYKKNEAQYQPGASSATSFGYNPGNPFTASNTYGNLTPEQLAKDYPNMTQADSEQYNDLVESLANGTATSEDYLAYKKLGSKFANAKKAAGASEVLHDFTIGGFSTTPPKPIADLIPATTKMPTPAWKKKGGAPPPLTKATGPNALSSGAELYAMKKAGKFNNDDEMWKAASKLSNQYKAQVQKANPGKKLVSGEDYSSPNQIRNVAQRLEFDEHGDVLWSTKEQLTSQTEGQTLSQMKQTISLHEHVGTQQNSKHTPGLHLPLGKQIWSDTSKPAGSYENPHAFDNVHALNDYGNQYTDHTGWNQQQKKAWYQFTGSFSGEINTYFRTQEAGFSSNSATVGVAKNMANNMIDAFNSKNVKPLKDWTVVTRGTSGGWEFGIGSDMVDFDDIAAMKGKVVRNKCPVSSSLKINPAFDSKKIHINYKLPPGFRGIFAGKHSSHPSENEWILPPGMAYRIDEVKEEGGKIHVMVEVVDVKIPEKFT